MSGVSVKVDDAAALAALRAAAALGANPYEMLLEISEYGAESTRERFQTQVGPNGTPWAPVQGARPETKKDPRILTGATSTLRNTIVPQATDTQASWGTNVVYALIHQLGGKTRPHEIRARRAKTLAFAFSGAGGDPVFRRLVHHPGSDIPARPFLGLDAVDRFEILDIIGTHVQMALKTTR